ncbi:MAG TPA: DUF2325 domain-containing protein [Polyangiaceae bacterium]|nr:DUF2325 domain-containing protein [Polyangiaceae bacterium]
MNIAIVGGLLRRGAEFTKIAESAGHSIEWHSGDVGGRGAEGLKAVVERADFVLILTEINSHGGMYVAKRAARQVGREALVLRKCGPARFQGLVEQWARAAPGGASRLRHCA